MVDKEMLTAMSEMMDQKLEVLEIRLEQKLDQKFDTKLEPIYDRLDRLESDITYVKEEQLENNVIPRLDRLEADMKIVKVDQMENGIIPRLNTIEECYLDTSKRYLEKTDQIDTMSSDISVLKSVVSNHSQRLSKIPV